MPTLAEIKRTTKQYGMAMEDQDNQLLEAGALSVQSVILAHLGCVMQHIALIVSAEHREEATAMVEEIFTREKIEQVRLARTAPEGEA